MPLPDFTANEGKVLLKLARETLQASFTDESDKPLKTIEHGGELTKNLTENLPCFITLTKKSGRLRGCVGSTVSYAPLYRNVCQFARQAAFEDPRFPPVEQKELSELCLGLTVLGPLERVSDPHQVKIGKHGLYVRFANHHGLLLAQVATMYRWEPAEFVNHTCLKAGLEPENWAKYEWSLFEEIGINES